MEQSQRSEDDSAADPDVVVECPACGRTPHVVLKEDSHATVRCTECGHVHKVKVQKPETVERRVVVSQGEDSFSTQSTMESENFIQVGDEFVLESDEGIFGVEVTSIEVRDEEGDESTKRVESTTADEVETVWTRTVDNVNVDVTVHSDGDSEGVKVRIPGDYSLVVGERLEVEERSYEITAFLTDEGGRFRYGGDDVEAKNAKRVYVE